jgi:phenylacetic acid degradation operon negative regulatory protein
MTGPIAAASGETAAPTLSRHHAAGAESARGLLFTILGEFVLPTGGSAWTSSFLDLFGRLHIEQKAARQALMRTAADGWLTAERIGRRTCWHLTPDAVELLTDGTERIYDFTATHLDWDGHWIVVLARAPERNRAVRHVLRTRLEWAGFGNVSPGVWVSTRTERRGEAERILDEAGVLEDALILDGEVIGGQPLDVLVTQAWDLAELEAGYEQFLRDFRSAVTADPLARLTELVHAWRRFPWRDPALPPDLLPARWHGARAAKLFADRHAAWSQAARTEWLALKAST